MAKGGKLAKLKCMIKKWQSASKLGRTNSSISANDDYDGSWRAAPAGQVDGLQAVYVGKSRRRYLISSHLVDHPLFRELADRSSPGGPNDAMIVGCEVVLFEHLLWMLENADPQPESLDELVEFYAC
ncbi:auxin-responsive protein SAUR76-like [Magnolia sinica]|uniref:auxin-responsive protein SAUR76-like n=1 Tax=Magnolia sinica TaxID=86752 RepID=UPI002659BD7D|nr:auxin-responsive protein SAUR76-like [Magnolia sinica]